MVSEVAAVQLGDTAAAGASVPAAALLWDAEHVPSPQTLDDADRRAVAGWAADCAERVLGIFETEVPGDLRPREAIARARAYARGELAAAGEIRRRFVAGRAVKGATHDRFRIPASYLGKRISFRVVADATYFARYTSTVRGPRVH